MVKVRKKVNIRKFLLGRSQEVTNKFVVHKSRLYLGVLNSSYASI